jgi:hypothetical protein
MKWEYQASNLCPEANYLERSVASAVLSVFMGFFSPSGICHDNEHNFFHIFTIHIRPITQRFIIYAAKKESLNKSGIIISNSVGQSPY